MVPNQPNVTLPPDQGESLVDLTEFGIHLTNRRGVCHKCGRETKPFSDGYTLDALCETCYHTERKDGNYAAYSPKTVWVHKTLDPVYARERYEGVVKIDGTLYHIIPMTGDSANVCDLATDATIKLMGLHFVSQHVLAQWYALQGNNTTFAHVVQFSWYSIKEELATEMHHHVNWLGSRIPIYDIGHGGRGWENDGRIYVRLYLHLREPTIVNQDDFDLLEVQLVKDADAPFLEGYQVASFPQQVINLKWDQAGPVLLKALASIRMDWEVEGRPRLRSQSADGDTRTSMQRLIDDTRQRYAKLRQRYINIPTDAWITLIVGYDPGHRPKHGIAHEVEHIIIHPY